MSIKGWRYYNHAAIPTCAPHEEPDITPIIDGTIWKNLGKDIPLLARWTTDWDCGYETSWWYCIIDKPFNISKLNAKRRYEITKGIRNFSVKQISPNEYIEELFSCYLKALDGYDTRQNVNKADFVRWCSQLSESYDRQRVYVALDKSTEELCAFLHVPVHEHFAALSTMKSIPSHERRGVNAALLYGVLEALSEDLCKENFYLTDGEKNVNHRTNFQSYLEKYFEFRKAYCKLHVEYISVMKFAVKICKLIRPILQKLDSISYVHLINAILTMDECANQSD